MTPDQLKTLGEAGWIIGPEESEKEFVKRVETQKAFSQKNLESIEAHPEAIALIQKRLEATPSWIQVRYSNRGLNIWEGAASWITDSGNWIQLRDSFKKGSFLGYQKEDVILHEAIHSLRFAFDEPRFEEILANAFAKRKWRRYLGSIFSTPKQACLFLVTLCLIHLAPIFPSGYLLYRLTSLIWDQRRFKKALQKIKRLFPKASNYAIALRLKDEEIVLFAREEESVCRDYIKGATNTMRWKQIRANFDLD